MELNESTRSSALRRYAAFTEDPEGGNPAGVWVSDALPPAEAMQRIAAEVGYSETAFVQPLDATRMRIRYYSPQAEVSFCGHATIATGVELGRRFGAGSYRLETIVGEVLLRVDRVDATADGFTASLTSVEPHQQPVPPALFDEVLASLGWRPDELDPSIPPVVAYAGARHVVLAAATRERLRDLHYDFDRLREAMLGADLTTIQLVWRESARVFHARNPFPVGGVVEDAATGASAAALGGHLRSLGAIEIPSTFSIRQGEDMGRPSRIEVSVPAHGGITVTGRAVEIDG